MHLFVCFLSLVFVVVVFTERMFFKVWEKKAMILFEGLQTGPNDSTNQKLKYHQVMVNSFWSFPCFSIPHPPDAFTRILGMYVLVTLFLFCGHKKLTLTCYPRQHEAWATITPHLTLLFGVGAGTAAVITTIYLPVRVNQEIHFPFWRGFFLKDLL